MRSFQNGLSLSGPLSVVFAIACLSFGKRLQLILALFILLLRFCSSTSLNHEDLLSLMCVNNCKYTLMWSLSSLLFC